MKGRVAGEARAVFNWQTLATARQVVNQRDCAGRPFLRRTGIAEATCVFGVNGVPEKNAWPRLFSRQQPVGGAGELPEFHCPGLALPASIRIQTASSAKIARS